MLTPYQKSKISYLTPNRHEDGEDDRGVVVEQVRDLGQDAGVLEKPIIAVSVALGTHDCLPHAILVANVKTVMNISR